MIFLKYLDNSVLVFIVDKVFSLFVIEFLFWSIKLNFGFLCLYLCYMWNLMDFVYVYLYFNFYLILGIF